MKNELINKDRRDCEDEIDLVDLLRILIKNKVTIIMITILVTAISLGAVLYMRYTRVDQYQQNFRSRNYIDEFYLKKANLKFEAFNMEEMMLEEENVDKIMSYPPFSEYIYKETSGKKLTLLEKQKFIKNHLMLERVMDETNKERVKYFTIKTNIYSEILSREMIEFYIGMINDRKVEIIKQAIKFDKNLIISERDRLTPKIKENEAKIKEIISELPSEMLGNQSIVSLITTTNPRFLEELNINKSLYSKYYSQAIGIEGLEKDPNFNRQIEKLSSIYQVEEKSKSLMILAIGMILGLFLGIFVAFTKEFITSVKWKEKK